MAGVVSIECSAESRRDLLSSLANPPAGASVTGATFRRCLWNVLRLSLILAVTSALARTEPTVEELKSRISAANVADKAKICLEIAEKQLNTTDKLYTADDVQKAQSSLTDVVSYSELARDYSIQSHKHQKQIEIAIRSMTRKLNDLLHVVGREEQAPLKEAITHLERVRDDLLSAMFPKGVK